MNHVYLCIAEPFRKRSPKGKADFYHAYVLMSKRLTVIDRNIPDQLRILTNLQSMQRVDYILLTNVILTQTSVTVTQKIKVYLQASVFDSEYSYFIQPLLTPIKDLENNEAKTEGTIVRLSGCRNYKRHKI